MKKKVYIILNIVFSLLLILFLGIILFIQSAANVLPESNNLKEVSNLFTAYNMSDETVNSYLIFSEYSNLVFTISVILFAIILILLIANNIFFKREKK